MVVLRLTAMKIRLAFTAMNTIRFSAFFYAANLWFAITLILLIGKHAERDSPVMYSFFGVGGWHSPTTYNTFVVLAAIAGGVLSCLSVVSLRQPTKDGP